MNHATKLFGGAFRVFAAGFAVVMSSIAVAQRGVVPEVRADEVYRARLEALTPDRPAAYFELAEEVLAGQVATRSRDLAVELLVLAYELDRLDGGTSQTAASAAIALASMPGSYSTRQWLLATAERLDPRQRSPAWLRPPHIETEESNGYQIAVALGLVRSGQGGLARQVLARPDVAGAVEAMDRTLRMMGLTGGTDGLKREAQRWPCRECGNERIVRKVVGGAPEYHICSNCGGLPGPRLTRGELASQLRIESLLLTGRQRAWAAQIATDGGAPLLDPDPASLADMYRIDVTRSLFRDGGWVAPAPKTAPAEKPQEEEAGEGVAIPEDK